MCTKKYTAVSFLFPVYHTGVLYPNLEHVGGLYQGVAGTVYCSHCCISQNPAEKRHGRRSDRSKATSGLWTSNGFFTEQRDEFHTQPRLER